jgi:hypothetical protein
MLKVAAAEAQLQDVDFATATVPVEGGNGAGGGSIGIDGTAVHMPDYGARHPSFAPEVNNADVFDRGSPKIRADVTPARDQVALVQVHSQHPRQHLPPVAVDQTLHFSRAATSTADARDASSGGAPLPGELAMAGVLGGSDWQTRRRRENQAQTTTEAVATIIPTTTLPPTTTSFDDYEYDGCADTMSKGCKVEWAPCCPLGDGNVGDLVGAMLLLGLA